MKTIFVLATIFAILLASSGVVVPVNSIIRSSGSGIPWIPIASQQPTVQTQEKVAYSSDTRCKKKSGDELTINVRQSAGLDAVQKEGVSSNLTSTHSSDTFRADQDQDEVAYAQKNSQNSMHLPGDPNREESMAGASTKEMDTLMIQVDASSGIAIASSAALDAYMSLPDDADKMMENIATTPPEEVIIA